MTRALFPALSRHDSQVIKGLAILLMIAHHYFTPIAMGIPRSPEAESALFWCWTGKSCVCLFAFITGYGYSSKIFSGPTVPTTFALLRSLGSFYKIYLFCMACVTLAFWFFPDERMVEPQNALGWLLSLGMIFPHLLTWWYATAFLWMTLVMAPTMAYCWRKRGNIRKCLPLLILSLMPFVLAEPRILDKTAHYLAVGDAAQSLYLHLKSIVCFLPWMLFGICYYALAHTRGRRRLLIGAVSMLLLLAWCYFSHPHMYVPLALASFAAIGVAIAVRQMVYLSSCLSVLGRYSVWMWLTHIFVFAYWFKPFFYELNAFFGFILVVLISLALGVALDRIFGMACRFSSWMTPILRRSSGTVMR